MKNETLVDTIEYREHRIEVHRDFDPMNPWEDWDCEVPILVAYDGRLHSYGVDESLPHLERPVVLAHWREMLDEMDLRNDWQGLLLFMRGDARYGRWGEPLDRLLAYEFEDHFNNLNVEGRLELLEKVYGWMGITAVLGNTSGYRQGDYAKVLAVATPKWVAATGAPPESHKAQCEGAIKLYGWWAWGDAYGYVVDGDGNSCWGFYGDDHEQSGLLDHARNDVDCTIQQHIIETDTEALTCD